MRDKSVLPKCPICGFWHTCECPVLVWEHEHPHTCKVCHADLSREGHSSWCENAPDPYASYDSEEWE